MFHLKNNAVIKKILKIAAIVIGIIIVLLIAADIWLNHWLNNKLPLILNQSASRKYDIRYHDFTIDFVTRRLVINQISILPMQRAGDRAGIEASIDKLVIADFSIGNLIWKKEIGANNLTINHPLITIHIDTTQKSHGGTMQVNIFLQDIFNRIRVKNIAVKNGSFTIDNKSAAAPVLELNKFDLALKNVLADSLTVNSPFPFRYQSLSFNGQQITYRINPYYTLKVPRVAVKNNIVQLDSVQLIPVYSKTNYQHQIKFQKDWYSLKIPQIKMSNLSWGFENNRAFITMQSLKINKADFLIYRDKRTLQPPFMQKPMPGTFLKQLPFQLTIDSLFMHQSKITYEEHPVTHRPPGKIIFAQIESAGAHITNDPDRLQKNSVCSVKAKSEFMNNTLLKADFTFKLSSDEDSFEVKGVLGSILDKTLNQPLEPLAGISVTGKIRQTDFTIRGNNIRATTSLRLLYDSLKLNILQNESKKKNWLLTAVAGIFTKKHNMPADEGSSATTYSFTRYQDRSFFNYLWNCVKKGALKTILNAKQSSIGKSQVKKLMKKSKPSYQRAHQQEAKKK